MFWPPNFLYSYVHHIHAKLAAHTNFARIFNLRPIKVKCITVSAKLIYIVIQKCISYEILFLKKVCWDQLYAMSLLEKVKWEGQLIELEERTAGGDLPKPKTPLKNIWKSESKYMHRN